MHGAHAAVVNPWIELQERTARPHVVEHKLRCALGLGLNDEAAGLRNVDAAIHHNPRRHHRQTLQTRRITKWAAQGGPLANFDQPIAGQREVDHPG